MSDAKREEIILNNVNGNQGDFARQVKAMSKADMVLLLSDMIEGHGYSWQKALFEVNKGLTLYR
jgi:hypothetical protein